MLEDVVGFNGKYVARMNSRDWFRDVEGTYVEFQTVLHHPRLKSLFVRYFDATSANLHWIDIHARAHLEEGVLVQVDAHLEKILHNAELEIDQGLAGANVLMEENGISSEPRALKEPLEVSAKIFSSYTRRFRSLLMKADRLVILLEGLKITGVIEPLEADKQVARVLRVCKALPRSAFSFVSGLRRQLNKGTSGETSGAQSAEVAADGQHAEHAATDEQPTKAQAAKTDCAGTGVTNYAGIE